MKAVKGHDEQKKFAQELSRTWLCVCTSNPGSGQAVCRADAGQPQTGKYQPMAKINPLTPPVKGSIPIAFPISEGTQLIDFAGPW